MRKLKIRVLFNFVCFCELHTGLLGSPGRPQTYVILLSQLPKFWNYTCVQSDAAEACLFYFAFFCVVLAIKLTALCMLGSTTELYVPPKEKKKERKKVTPQYTCHLFHTCYCESVQKSVFYTKTKKQDMGEHVKCYYLPIFFKIRKSIKLEICATVYPSRSCINYSRSKI